jgi:hypothetical protein
MAVYTNVRREDHRLSVASPICMAAQWTMSDHETPGPPPSGPRFPVPAESGIGDSLFPDSGRVGIIRFPRFPEKTGKSGNRNRGNRESDFLSDEYQLELQWTRNILSREYHANAFTGSMRLLFRVRDSEREHAAGTTTVVRWQHPSSLADCG